MARFKATPVRISARRVVRGDVGISISDGLQNRRLGVVIRSSKSSDAFAFFRDDPAYLVSIARESTIGSNLRVGGSVVWTRTPF